MTDPNSRELFEELVRTLGMGEIKANVLLENEVDVLLCKTGRLSRSEIRKVEVEAVADTGAVLLLLPQDLVEKLGLYKTYKTIVTLANDQKIELDRAGGLILTIGDRHMSTDCLVGPPGCEPLIGQIVMESLDLIADPLKRTLTPRPESPYLPNLKMKQLASVNACVAGSVAGA